MVVSWPGFRALLSCFFYLTIDIGLDSQLMKSTYFRTVRWPNGTNLCATLNPTGYSVTSSTVSCSDACRKSSGCGNFNYDSVTKTCGTYGSRPTCYAYVSSSCYHYEMESYPTKADTGKNLDFNLITIIIGDLKSHLINDNMQLGIPPEECRIPFTYDMKLHENCSLNLVGDGCMNCMGPDWTIVKCHQPNDFFPKTQETTISVPTFATTFPVLSINRWIVFLYRFDGSLDFAQPWQVYKDGFGSPPGEYWLGLEKLAQLTNSGQYRARFEISTLENGSYFSAEYDSFVIDPENLWYAIHVSGYNGDAGDLFWAKNPVAIQNHMNFTTYDSDNDGYNPGSIPSYNCAYLNGFNCGYWYNACMFHSLTAPVGSKSYYHKGIQNLGMAKDSRLNTTRVMIQRV